MVPYQRPLTKKLKIFFIARLDMTHFNKLVNHNGTDQTAQAGLCLCCYRFSRAGPITCNFVFVWTLKEDNSCMFTLEANIQCTVYIARVSLQMSN